MMLVLGYRSDEVMPFVAHLCDSVEWSDDGILTLTHDDTVTKIEECSYYHAFMNNELDGFVPIMRRLARDMNAEFLRADKVAG